MPPELYPLGRWLHLTGGFAAVGVGFGVMLLPKFGRRAGIHRWAGRLYASLIAAACLLGVPLAYRRDDTYLMMLGFLTLAVVVQGWLDARAARRAFAIGDGATASRRLRWHVMLMGASYIGAWSGFFATNPVFGNDREWLVWLYVFGPSVVGGVLIARALLRLQVPTINTSPPARSP